MQAQAAVTQIQVFEPVLHLQVRIAIPQSTKGIRKMSLTYGWTSFLMSGTNSELQSVCTPAQGSRIKDLRLRPFEGSQCVLR